MSGVCIRTQCQRVRFERFFEFSVCHAWYTAGNFVNSTHFAEEKEYIALRPKDRTETGIMFIRWCPISLGFFFQTALEVKELQDGRLVGNELECAMVRRMGGLEQSEAQIYPKFIQKESLTRNLPLFGWCNAAVSFFFFVFQVWWHADSPWVAFWSCKYDQWSGDTKPLSCIGDCCGHFLFAWQHGICLCQVETPVTQSLPSLTQVEVCWKLLWKVVQKWSSEGALHHPCHQTMTPWWCNLPKPPGFSHGVDVCRFTYHAPWKVVKNRGATRKPISIPSAFATKPCHRWLRSKLPNCHGRSWKKSCVLWVCCCFRMRWNWKRLKPLKSWSLHAARNGAVRSSVWKTLDKNPLVMVVVVQHLPSVFDTVLTQYSI